MNDLIETIFTNFTVDGVGIPVEYLRYRGNEDTYVTYHPQDIDNSLTADDELQGYVYYYDFDVYSKGNYLNVVKSVIEKLENNGFVWQPSRSRPDTFEDDTELYHRTLNFAIPVQNKEDLNNG